MLACLRNLGLLLVVLSMCAGCGESGPRTFPVSGQVTFDGQEVAEGEIIFRSAEGPPETWAGKITAGRYAIRSTAGAKRVEITATRKVPAPAAASGEAAINVQMYIPARYNEKSELTATVKASGGNQFDFALTP